MKQYICKLCSRWDVLWKENGTWHHIGRPGNVAVEGRLKWWIVRPPGRMTSAWRPEAGRGLVTWLSAGGGFQAERRLVQAPRAREHPASSGKGRTALQLEESQPGRGGWTAGRRWWWGQVMGKPWAQCKSWAFTKGIGSPWVMCKRSLQGDLLGMTVTIQGTWQWLRPWEWQRRWREVINSGYIVSFWVPPVFQDLW